MSNVEPIFELEKELPMQSAVDTINIVTNYEKEEPCCSEGLDCLLVGKFNEYVRTTNNEIDELKKRVSDLEEKKDDEELPCCSDGLECVLSGRVTKLENSLTRFSNETNTFIKGYKTRKQSAKVKCKKIMIQAFIDTCIVFGLAKYMEIL